MKAEAPRLPGGRRSDLPLDSPGFRVSPDQAERQKWIEHTEKCIEIAYALGVPCIRLNSGRWKTIKSFDDLMKRARDRTGAGRLQGRRRLQVVHRIDCEMRGVAAQRGVILALENHWGLSRTPEGQLRIIDAIKSLGSPRWSIPGISWRTRTTRSRKSLRAPLSCRRRL
jgi:sugar phosphate isomerase/epimerase